MLGPPRSIRSDNLFPYPRLFGADSGSRRSPAGQRAAVSVVPASPEPLYRQLYFAIREGILAGRLAPGLRLPATRALASDLGLSRNTVVAAFEQLLAEGYIEGRVGAGSYASATLPEDLLNARAAAGARDGDRKSVVEGKSVSVRGDTGG